jgi:hypothetical protein
MTRVCGQHRKVLVCGLIKIIKEGLPGHPIICGNEKNYGKVKTDNASLAQYMGRHKHSERLPVHQERYYI